MYKIIISTAANFKLNIFFIYAFFIGLIVRDLHLSFFGLIGASTTSLSSAKCRKNVSDKFLYATRLLWLEEKECKSHMVDGSALHI